MALLNGCPPQAGERSGSRVVSRDVRKFGDGPVLKLGVPTQSNVNPGLINPRLINRGCPLLVGIHHFWREHPPNNGFINPGSRLVVFL